MFDPYPDKQVPAQHEHTVNRDCMCLKSYIIYILPSYVCAHTSISTANQTRHERTTWPWKPHQV